MKVIGLIGGMSWESSLEYYRIINELIKKKLGNLHSAECILYSVDFEEIEGLQKEEKWEELSKIMLDKAKALQAAGAEFIVICTNTMHLLADNIINNSEIHIALLHIADATGIKIKEENLSSVGLIGTKFTMEKNFYKKILRERYELRVIIPEPEEREIIHNIIYDELCVGKILDSSKSKYLKIIDSLINNGAEGIVLGCTEIPLLVKQEDIKIPIFDTTYLHAEHAVNYALNNTK